MAHFVNEKCYKCKYTDCVEVCPVDCFYEGPDMLYIHPEECIDCGVCIPECPIDAIEDDSLAPIISIEQRTKILEINCEGAKSYPRLTKKRSVPHPEEPVFKHRLDKAMLLGL